MAMTLHVHHEDGWSGEVTLDGKDLAGDLLVVRALEAADADRLGQPVKASPVGPFYDEPLTDPVGVYLLALDTFVIVDVDRSGDDPRAMLDALMGEETDGQQVVY